MMPLFSLGRNQKNRCALTHNVFRNIWFALRKGCRTSFCEQCEITVTIRHMHKKKKRHRERICLINNNKSDDDYFRSYFIRFAVCTASRTNHNKYEHSSRVLFSISTLCVHEKEDNKENRLIRQSLLSFSMFVCIVSGSIFDTNPHINTHWKMFTELMAAVRFFFRDSNATRSVQTASEANNLDMGGKIEHVFWW